ncbi:MAG: ATP-binding protein [Planctomycetota bacterium]
MNTEADPRTAPARGPLARLVDHVRLPGEPTAFERKHVARMNRYAMWFFAAHVPILTALAALNGTGPVAAALLSAAVLLVPVVALRVLENERTRSCVFGFTAMCMGGVLVHVGQGPVQIEMHFYFFALLAMLAVFGNPMVVIVGAATVAVHHLALWFLAPASVFNYEAPLWVVLVHAAFVVLETPVACFMARTFFDNVIGLERQVAARTAELDARNRSMRLVLDNVGEGLVVAGLDGTLHGEASLLLTDRFGPIQESDTLASYLGRRNEESGAWLALAWESLEEGFMPLEVVLDQLPGCLEADGALYSLEYEPMTGANGELESVFVVLRDVTAEVAARALEQDNRETMALFQRTLADRPGLERFVVESRRLMERVQDSLPEDAPAAKRPLHTLKGNAGFFGLETIASGAHRLETAIEAHEEEAVDLGLQSLVERWTAIESTVEDLLSKGGGPGAVVLGRDEFDRILDLVIDGAEHASIAAELTRATLERTSTRLEEIGAQARALAERLERGEIDVALEDNGVRLDRDRFGDFWLSFVHVVRNAVDHGLETPEERAAQGKPSQGRIAVRTYIDGGDDLVVEFSDDGRGVDWERVRERADALGAEFAEKDPTEALFASGLSTREEATGLSGRGVGLAAVKEACDALGGTIRLETEKGSSTTFQFRFPGALAASGTNH